MIAGCKIALTVQIKPSGGFQIDTGYWQFIARDAHQVIENCMGSLRNINVEPSGGGGNTGKFFENADVFGHVWITDDGSIGTRRMLDLSIYDHNSLFDNATKWRFNRHIVHGGISKYLTSTNLTTTNPQPLSDE